MIKELLKDERFKLWLYALGVAIALVAAVILIVKTSLVTDAEITFALSTVTDFIGLTTTAIGAMFGAEAARDLAARGDATATQLATTTAAAAVPIAAGILLLLVP